MIGPRRILRSHSMLTIEPPASLKRLGRLLHTLRLAMTAQMSLWQTWPMSRIWVVDLEAASGHCRRSAMPPLPELLQPSSG